MSNKRGVFIVLEGIDRSGKTTACTAVAKLLRSEGVKLITRHFPTRDTPIGTLISQHLSGDIDFTDETRLLLMAADRREAATVINAYLNGGNVVICDRYASSGAAYGYATQTSGMTIEECLAPDNGLLKPDVVIYFDLDPEVAATRKGFGEERLETIELQTRVHAAYRRIMTGDWMCVDATLPPDELAAEVAAVCRMAIDAARENSMV